MKKWYQSKTIWASLATICTGFGLYFSGEQNMEALILSIVGAVFAILRVVTDEPIK